MRRPNVAANLVGRWEVSNKCNRCRHTRRNTFPLHHPSAPSTGVAQKVAEVVQVEAVALALELGLGEQQLLVGPKKDKQHTL